MRPIFHAELVNGDGGDPALFVDFQFMNQALLFDLGDLSSLSPKKMLRVTAAFVSHTHMDHFIGFDCLLRTFLGRDKRLLLFGPPGFIGHVHAKLSAYTWNLVGNYSSSLSLFVKELHPEGRCESALFESRKRFTPEYLEPCEIAQGTLIDNPLFRVKFEFLDHVIPCLAFSLEEKSHVNIWKNRIEELGLPKGAWLKSLKEAVLRHEPDDTVIVAE